MLPVRCPPALERGSRVRVVAPAGPFDRTLALRGMGWLAQRYRVEFDWGMFSQAGFLAGSDERRRNELEAALREPGLGAIIAARGGYGVTRIAHQLDWALLSAAPRWLVGFSDITGLHIEAQAQGVVSLHGHNAAGLGRGDAHARAAWLRALEQPQSGARFSALECWVPGRVEGPFVGGNLTLLATCALSGRWRPPAGCVLFIEDVAEAPYRIDRSLNALYVSGLLRGVAAVVAGEFTGCRGRYGVDVKRVLREQLGQLGVPVAAGLPAGHGRHNAPLHLGAHARLDVQRGELVLQVPDA